jgi:hypothetical protein
MTQYQELREKVEGTSALINYTISKCEISASESNYKEFNQAVDDTEMLMNEVRKHINELQFLSKLQRLAQGSIIINSSITKRWYLMKTEKYVNTDFDIPQYIINAIEAKYKLQLVEASNNFLKYELQLK